MSINKITKVIVKDYIIRRCPYLTLKELDDNSLIELLKKFIQNKGDLDELVSEVNDDDEQYESTGFFNVKEILEEYPYLKQKIKDIEKSKELNPLDELIEKYQDNELVSNLSRRYFELKYGKEHCARCDIDEDGNQIFVQDKIIENTKRIMADNNIKVVFEGQEQTDCLRARFDVIIKNNDVTFDLIEVKGTTDVFKHPKKDKIIDTGIKTKYLYDLLFQYRVYKECGYKFNNISYMYIDRNYILNKDIYPTPDEDLESLFTIRNNINLKDGSRSLKQYFDLEMYVKGNDISIETAINEIKEIQERLYLEPTRKYFCRKGADKCPFMKICFETCDNKDDIFNLTAWTEYGGHWSYNNKLMDEHGIENISDISDAYVEDKYPLTRESKEYGTVYRAANSQIMFEKGEIIGDYIISKKMINKVLDRGYFTDGIDHLVFFDFESFQNPIPLVKDSGGWKQVVSQYSMHIVNRNYDLSKHDFEKGVGGEIKHYEFIGNPDKDKYENPCFKLYETLYSQFLDAGINPTANNFKVVVFNQNFERLRMKEYVNNFKGKVDDSLIDFVDNLSNNIVDLLDFFTIGSIYGREFKGKGSLKVIQPTLTQDKKVVEFYNKKNLPFDLAYSLDYHKDDKCLVYNGEICLELYKSLLLRSHFNETSIGPSTQSLLDEALAYCKIDTWGTVILYDIIKNIADGTLVLDATYR